MNNPVSFSNLSCKDISIRYVFQKMYSPQGVLVAVECLSRFDLGSLSPEYIFRHSGINLRERIFMEQLALIEKHRAWFIKHNVIATINVDDDTLTLLYQPAVKEIIKQLGFIHFEVNEHSRALLDNTSLDGSNKSNSSTFWLDDFGSGHAHMSAIRHYHFDYVKIDKDFFWYLIRKDSGRQLMDALVTFLTKNKHNVIIEGVECIAHKDWLSDMCWFAVQGHYWEEVSIEQLTQKDVPI